MTRKKKRGVWRPSDAEIVTAVNEARSVDKAAKVLGLSRQGIYGILERLGLGLVSEKCSECGRKRRGKVVAEMRAVEKAAP